MWLQLHGNVQFASFTKMYIIMHNILAMCHQHNEGNLANFFYFVQTFHSIIQRAVQ